MEKEVNTKLYKIVGYSVMIFIFVGIIVMFAAAIYSRTQKIGVVYCEFPYIGDVQFDDAFTMNGKYVGFVKHIYSNEPNRTILTIYLKSPITVHENYKLFIGDVGIMGERVVCIENGPQEAPIISLSDTLKGKYYPGISDMLGKIMDLRDFLDVCIDFVDKISYGTDSSKSIIDWINNAEDLIDNFLSATKTTMESWDKDIPEIIEKIDDININLDLNLVKLAEILPDITEKIDILINDSDTLLTKISEIENIANDVKGFVVGIDTLFDVNSINKTIADLQKEIVNIYDGAAKLRIFLVKNRQPAD